MGSIILILITTSFTGCVKNWNPRYGIKYKVEVVKVIDGDTFDVILPNGTIGRIRLLGVDCPETTAENNKRYEYDSIVDLECLATYGLEAKDYAENILTNKIVYIQFDPQAGFKGYYGRWLAYIFLLNQTDFGEELLKHGYARVYVEGNFSKEDCYLNIENQAIENKTGLWSCPSKETYGIVILTVHYNAEGRDEENLNDEYVVIKNIDTTPIDVTGYRLNDEVNHTYYFPEHYIIEPGVIVKIHTGSGNNTEYDLYWNNDYPIWNNNGDTAYLWNADDILIDTYRWG
ncbi:MAG: nuclease [Thermoplasmata archaeon]|nr:MAG: nuclease [Thermoplasmata archaeon]